MRISLPIYLAFKEIWRNRLRFSLVTGIIALITILVLFIVALSDGLGFGNREYLVHLNADMLVYQQRANLLLQGSLITQDTIQALRRNPEVAAVGAIGVSDTSIALPASNRRLRVRMLGVIPGMPGEPPIVQGRGFSRADRSEAIIDSNIARETKALVGDTITIVSREGNEEKLYTIQVVGISTSQQFNLQPTIFLPYQTWDLRRPQAEGASTSGAVSFNFAAVRLRDPAQSTVVAQQLAQSISNIQIVDIVTAYEALPGYLEQARTFELQKWFLLIIGALVIGGFFQIQLIQRVAQVGVLRAIGISRWLVTLTFLLQVVLITALGIFLGAAITLGLSRLLPPSLPAVFDPTTLATTVALLLLTGPLGSAVAIRSLLKIEPLAALRLSM